MELFNNPFYILGATTKDNRQKIMQLANERSLFGDSEKCEQAAAILTNPPKRLIAELSWFPGVSTKKTSKIVDFLKDYKEEYYHKIVFENVEECENAEEYYDSEEEYENAEEYYDSEEEYENAEEYYDSEEEYEEVVDGDGKINIGYINSIAKSNFILYLFENDSINIVNNIIMIAEEFDNIDYDELSLEINEDRVLAKIPQIDDFAIFEEAMNNHRLYIKKVIVNKLDYLPIEKLISIVTPIVEETTLRDTSYIIIDDILDFYEIKTKALLDKKLENILNGVEIIQKDADNFVVPISKNKMLNFSKNIDKLCHLVEKWDKIAQPMQLNSQLKGLDHQDSINIAKDIRNFAIELYNKHYFLDHTIKLIQMLRDTFGELDIFSEMIEKDIIALENIRREQEIEEEAELAMQQYQEEHEKPISTKNQDINCSPNVENSNTKTTNEDEIYNRVPHPWVRYFARMFDLYIGSIMIAFLWASLSPSTYNKIFAGLNNYFATVLTYVVWLIIESLLISSCKITPGKWIFNSNVVSTSGEKITFSKALLRNFSMFLNGLGLSIPVVSLFTLGNSYNKLKDSSSMGMTLWDMQTNSIVIHRKIKPIRIILSSVILISILFGASYLANYDNQKANAVSNQLTIEKARLDKEYNYLSNTQNQLKIEADKVLDLYNEMKQWELDGNSEEYNNNIDKYNNMYESVNDEEQKLETRRVKYNKDIEEYNKKLEVYK